jgi:hypothetical protein
MSKRSPKRFVPEMNLLWSGSKREKLSMQGQKEEN